MTSFQKWRLLAPLGLATIGFGTSLLGHSVQIKTEGVATLTWFLWGTLSLVVLNAGVAIFGDAVKHRVLYELRRQEVGDRL
jgi:hypothetical protein